jgi:hypothetical protein
MQKVISIDDPNEKLQEIDQLIKTVFNGFLAVAMDYGYHINNVFGSSEKEKQKIYELRNNMNYRLRSSKLHFHLLLRRKIEIEYLFSEMLKNDPQVFNGFYIGNPHFEAAADEIMGMYDSIIFHLSSSFDYLAMLIQFIFGDNPQKKLQWITLAKLCYSKDSEYQNRIFKENIQNVDRDFVSKFNDYRAELIHRKKSTSYADVTWEIQSGKVDTHFVCSENIKTHLKKIINKDNDYCITFVSYEAIKQTVMNIANVLEGINDEFRTNYNPHSPVMNGGAQIISISEGSAFAESPSLSYWNEFMKYKNTDNSSLPK